MAAPLPDQTPLVCRRLNWGCGPATPKGWINADRLAHPGVDLPGDIRDGLDLADGSIDYAVAMHALQDLAWADIPPALAELKRVMRSGGVLRLGLPDLDRAIEAYMRGDAAYFYVPDRDARSLGAKLVTQIIWYGSVRTPMTYAFVRECLEGVGFRDVQRCSYRRSRSGIADIVALDNRERESLFVEARA